MHGERGQCIKQRETVNTCRAELQDKGSKREDSYFLIAQFTHLLPESWAMGSIGKAIHTNPECPSETEPL